MYNIQNSYELYHHGIPGQKWGVQNGPPYPLSDRDKTRIEKLEAKRNKYVRKLSDKNYEIRKISDKIDKTDAKIAKLKGELAQGIRSYYTYSNNQFYSKDQPSYSSRDNNRRDNRNDNRNDYGNTSNHKSLFSNRRDRSSQRTNLAIHKPTNLMSDDELDRYVKRLKNEVEITTQGRKTLQNAEGFVTDRMKSVVDTYRFVETIGKFRGKQYNYMRTKNKKKDEDDDD